jgi:excisionase family DNA binding protein
MMEKLAYTVKEAIRATGIPKSTLYEEISAGRLASRKMPGKTLLLRADLERFLEALPVGQ